MSLKKCVLFLAIAFSANSLFAVNLFSTNVGFETAISPWKLSFHDTLIANATITLDSVGPKFGKKYCKINVTKVEANADTAKAHNWYIQLWEPTWQTKQNVKYTYSFWAKSGDTNSHPINIAATGDTTDEYAYRDGNNCTITKEWQLLSFSYTWADAGTKKHFRLFVGSSKGPICIDSMTLDTGAVATPVKPFALSNRTATFDYGVQVLPNSMRIVFENPAVYSNNMAIYSMEGRLISSRTIPAATSTFDIAKPAPGAWVVDVNSNKKVIQVP